MNFLNSWNRFRYTIYTPFYDFLLQGFDGIRQKALSLSTYRSEEKILIVGAGTGRDLNFLPIGPKYYLTDITPSMLKKAKILAERLGHNYKVVVCSGDQLPFPREEFDKVILCFIVAIIPNPQECLNETYRVLKADGEVVILDKFAIENEVFFIRWIKAFFNLFTCVFFSSINRIIEPMAERAGFKIVEDHYYLFGKIFRGILLKKDN